jgi:hypothetical protein
MTNWLVLYVFVNDGKREQDPQAEGPSSLDSIRTPAAVYS